MKPNRIQSNDVKWDPHTFYDEDFVPIIPSGGYEDDSYEASRVGDGDLADSIRDILANSNVIDVTDIYVNVDKLNVSLIGTVPDSEMKSHVEDVVRQIEGVGTVRNHLSVEYGRLKS